MTGPVSISGIDFMPLPGKTYFNVDRDWREGVIYFLMTDRFHDSTARATVRRPQRSLGFATQNTFYGGTIPGITEHLDYIAGLGCTAIWLSPVFENNPNAYHGYDINNYLNIDRHFGTKQDLIDLVERAHGFRRQGEPWPMCIILDVVINHSGDNWSYPGDFPYFYFEDEQFAFGNWRRDDLCSAKNAARAPRLTQLYLLALTQGRASTRDAARRAPLCYAPSRSHQEYGDTSALTLRG